MSLDSTPLQTARTRTRVDLDSENTKTQVRYLHEYFEIQVDRRPDAPALVTDEATYSYGEVEDRANRLAAALRVRGVQPGMLVGLYSGRSAEAIIAILAVLKAGGGYVPIDPAFPEERIRHIVDVASVSILLCPESLCEDARQYVDDMPVVIDGEEIQIDHCENGLDHDAPVLTEHDLCYVIFTSGTTGRPKGVMTEHANAVSFVEAFRGVCRLTVSDRVYQGFSLGFDGSVEEIWMAFAVGAALVIGASEAGQLGDDVARAINRHKATFFSTVPTSLSMICVSMPTVRLLVVSGEPCPPELIEKWATSDRRMINVYGPTETTVNATVAECRPGVPVTIGRPLSGYDFYVLDEQRNPVPVGQAGELYIGGPGLARGYIAEPELTEAAFVSADVNGKAEGRRLYRTGDLVKWDQAGELLFLGRIDTQVKIRGYRIELAEIEAVLAECPAIRSAVVKVYEENGVKELAAYVTQCSESNSLDAAALRSSLEGRLPAYMIPHYLEFVSEIPTLASGKADRSRLPRPKNRFLRRSKEVLQPEGAIETVLESEWAAIFEVDAVSVTDNFFTDLGGYSLVAAKMVSVLRTQHGFDVALREVYENPTIRELATKINVAGEGLGAGDAKADSEKGTTARDRYEQTPSWRRQLLSLLQAVSLYPVYGLTALPAAIAVFAIVGVWQQSMEIATALWIWVAVFLGYFPGMLLLSIATKWVVIGRYRPGEYSRYSFYYFRWWLVSRIQSLSGVRALEGTPLLVWYFRLMGARVGRGCILDSSLASAFDLLEIGDETSVGNETQLPGYRVENGVLRIGSVTIGSGCYVGIHSYLGLNCCLEDDSRVGDLSAVGDGETLSRGEAAGGSPLRPLETAVPKREEAAPLKSLPSWLCGLAHVGAVYFIQVVFLVMAVPSVLVLAGAWLSGSLWWLGLALVISGPVGFLSFCLGVPLVKRLLLPAVKPGVYPVESWFYLRKWIVDALTRASRVLVLPLYTTIYFPTWLRWLGAKVGPRAEIATVSQISPDLMEISAESFFADGSIIGGRRFDRGLVELAISRVGRRSFVGNSAILPVGAHLGDACLVGCLSATPPDGETPQGTEWLGSPAFELPYRKKVEGFDEAVTFRPSSKLYALRCIVDAFRILVPTWLTSGSWLAFAAGVYFISESWGWAVAFIAVPVLSLFLAVAKVLGVVLIKWSLMGRFRPILKPLWSLFVWLNELVNGAYESVVAPVLSPMLGTPFFAPFLRMLGCKIGRDVFLETTLFSEFDLVTIGDHASLNLGAVIQNHLFEDRIMKASTIAIRDQVNVGNMAVVLYDTELQSRASLEPMSLVMKGETLPSGCESGGIPSCRRAGS